MSEYHDIKPAEVGQAPAALDFARAYYAGAMLAARHRPDDLHRQKRAEEAWKEYMEALRRESRLSAVMPDDFEAK